MFNFLDNKNAAFVVGIPSATLPNVLIITSNFSPLPSLNPTVKFLHKELYYYFNCVATTNLDFSDVAVKIKSPIPLKPRKVVGFALRATPTLVISDKPRVNKAALVFKPNYLELLKQVFFFTTYI